MAVEFSYRWWAKDDEELPYVSVDYRPKPEGEAIGSWMKHNGTGVWDSEWINDAKIFRFRFSDERTALLFKLFWG